MKVISLNTNPEKYSSNVYLVLGEWKTLNDVNALIDTGADDYIIRHLELINTGLGKNKLEVVVLTHNHFDHTGGIKALKEKYQCKVYGKFEADYVDVVLRGNELLKLGDRYYTVIDCPLHSSDSICLYNGEKGILFSGDTELNIRTNSGSYPQEYLESLLHLQTLNLKIIYPGHGHPYDNPAEMLEYSINNVIKSIQI